MMCAESINLNVHYEPGLRLAKVRVQLVWTRDLNVFELDLRSNDSNYKEQN